MKRWVKLSLAAAGVTLCLAVAWVGVAWVLWDNGCGNTVLSSYPSPEGKHIVVVFQRDCGATTGFSTQASMLPATTIKLPDETGNLFVATGPEAPIGAGGGPELRVHWNSEGEVVLSHHPAVTIHKAVTESGGVRIMYSSFL